MPGSSSSPPSPTRPGISIWRAALGLLGERGLTRLLVEGGGRLAAALLRAGLVDRLVWLHAPLLLGGDAVPAVAALGLDRLADAPGFERLSSETVGEDVLTIFRAGAALPRMCRARSSAQRGCAKRAG